MQRSIEVAVLSVGLACLGVGSARAATPDGTSPKANTGTTATATTMTAQVVPRPAPDKAAHAPVDASSAASEETRGANRSLANPLVADPTFDEVFRPATPLFGVGRCSQSCAPCILGSPCPPDEGLPQSCLPMCP